METKTQMKMVHGFNLSSSLTPCSSWTSTSAQFGGSGWLPRANSSADSAACFRCFFLIR
jgi:hypothetical protein